ncbi:hypothetical protein E7V67_021675 [[Empedobacter] haloabium]|uniref:Tle cognate immunity protein 4 C-terminal domain-containing protein n=1 Tax=[Empedobacter] haloabium TaxID=592317 RepID=A0ABZ1UHX8_9BURK
MLLRTTLSLAALCCATGASAAWKTAAQQGLDPVRLLVEPALPAGEIAFDYRAARPGDKGVPLREFCRGAPKIPVWGGSDCRKSADSISEKLHAAGPAVTMHKRLAGPGDYRLATIWLGDAQFGVTERRPGNGVAAYRRPGSDVIHTVRVDDPALGLQSSATLAYEDTPATAVHELGILRIEDAPLAYTGATNDIVVDRSRLGLDMSAWDLCEAGYSETLKATAAAAWPTLRDHYGKLTHGTRARCVGIRAQDSALHERAARILVDRDGMLIQLRWRQPHDDLSETIVIDSRGQALYYHLNRWTSRNGEDTTRFQHWVPGLENIYPAIAIAPEPARVRQLQDEYLWLFNDMARAKAAPVTYR